MRNQVQRILVFAAVILMGLTAALSHADARRGGGRGGGRGHAGMHRSVNLHRNAHINRNMRGNRHFNRSVGRRAVVGGAVVGHRYHGGIYYGRGRRYWHGRWWAYGVGSCWRLTPDGYYVWVCF